MRFVLLIGLLASPQAGWANGQTTHLWITDTAVGHVEIPELAELLAAQMGPLRVGTMFPDGGYPLNHEYGEVAHWEPFQDAYRDWIRTQFPNLSSADAAPHIAFYLGLASHGMADQVFDSMYMERSRIYDAEYGWADQSTALDLAQDIVFAAQTTTQTVPEPWIPDHFPDLFAGLGVDVDMDTMLEGQDRLDIAVRGTGGLSEIDAAVTLNGDAFPWGCSHLLDETVPGSPPFEAKVVAKYWAHLWRELHGEPGELDIIGVFPTPNSMGHATDAEDIEAKLSLVFSRGLLSENVTEEHFRAQSSETVHEIGLNLFYRDHSHVVNISPVNDWATQTEHTLTVMDTLEATDGRRLAEPYILPFSTVPMPTEDTGQNTPNDTGNPAASGKGDCGCATHTQPSMYWLLLLLSLLAVRRQPSSTTSR